MPVDNGDILRIALRQKHGETQDVVNVYHLRCIFTGSLPEADVLAAVSGYFSSAYNDVESWMPTVQVPIDIKVDKIMLIGGKIEIVATVGVTTWDPGFDPSGAGEALPRGVSALIFLLTSVGKVFGRKFIGTLTEAATAGDSLVPAALTALGNMAAKLIVNRVIDADHLLQPGVLSTRTLQFEPFMSARVRAIPAYQRRRTPGVGS